MPPRILFTNNTLMRWAGTERAVHDAAVHFHRRGWDVRVFSPQHGEVAESLVGAGVRVMGRVADCDFDPDVIHGHHQWETSIAALRWPEAGLLSFCRGENAWQEAPCPAAWTFRYVAIDANCRRRLEDAGIPRDRIVTLLNGVDLGRFTRRPPLPTRPKRALVFSNYATEGSRLDAVRIACREAGLELEVIGAGVGRPHPNPEDILGSFDVVFAKGRAALEALAAGCSVVVCDVQGLGPMVTAQNFTQLRNENFGFSCMANEVSPENVADRLAGFDSADAGAVCDAVRASCGLDRNFAVLETLYREAASSKGPRPAREIADLATRILDDKLAAAKIGRELELEYRKRTSSTAPASPAETGAEFNRILHQFRRGWDAWEAAKHRKKSAPDPAPSGLAGRIAARFRRPKR